MYVPWVHQSLPYPEQLLRVTGPGRAAWILGLQCNVQKLDSWTKNLLAEQICAHLSKVLWYKPMSLAHSEVQWMMHNPKKHKGCSKSHRWPAVCEWTSSLMSSLHVPPPYLFKWELHLPVNVKPWTCKSSKKIVLQVGLIWTDQASWYKSNTLFGRQEVAIHSQGLSDVQLPLHPGTSQSLSAWRDTFMGEVSYQPRFSLSEVYSSFVYSFVSFMSLPCHCLFLAFLHLMWFLAFYCY